MSHWKSRLFWYYYQLLQFQILSEKTTWFRQRDNLCTMQRATESSATRAEFHHEEVIFATKQIRLTLYRSSWLSHTCCYSRPSLLADRELWGSAPRLSASQTSHVLSPPFHPAEKVSIDAQSIAESDACQVNNETHTHCNVQQTKALIHPPETESRSLFWYSLAMEKKNWPFVALYKQQQKNNETTIIF